MGLETIAIIGASAASSFFEAQDAQRKADAVIAQGDLDAANKAKQIRAKAASAKISFLNSGFTLAGTPANAIQSIFKVGIEDINQITKNARVAAGNIVSDARSKAISGALGGLGGLFEGFGDDDITGGPDPQFVARDKRYPSIGPEYARTRRTRIYSG